MFTITEIPAGTGTLQERRETYTGLRCRISPERINRHINRDVAFFDDPTGCPFCPDKIFTVTPVFSDKKRIIMGESVTFPNLFPFGEFHTVTVITRDHRVSGFSQRQIADALSAQTEALMKSEGYASINWNYLPSAGASLVHPHMQALSDKRPSFLPERYLHAVRQYYSRNRKPYWQAFRDGEVDSARYLFGDEIFWHAHAVPIGEREIRGILPISSVKDLVNYTEILARDILSVISFYESFGTCAFNMSIFFDKSGQDRGFCAFCSMISRINPNMHSTSDSAYMERLHLQPVILTLPEDLGTWYRNERK